MEVQTTARWYFSAEKEGLVSRCLLLLDSGLLEGDM